jgi:3-oxoacyl-[acyl-carrier protein] reductase
VTYNSANSGDEVTRLVHKVQELKNDFHALGIRADLRSPESVDLIVAKAVELGGPKPENKKHKINILVNNAGLGLVKHLGTITPEDFDSTFNLNVRGTLLMTQAVLPHLPRARRIINVSSVGARSGFPGLSVYCSSKAAVEGLTRCWAAELGKNGTTVNCVNPGPVQTALIEKIPPEIVEQQKKSTPIENRIGTVDDIAKIVAWLAGEESRWVTGQVISASGGWAMY